MSKSSNIRRTIGLLFVFAVCVAFVCADLFVSSARIGSQNTKTTPQDETTRGGVMTSNSNTGSTNMGAKRRRKRRRAQVAVTQNASMTTSDMSGAQTDLSGTYTGTVNYPEGGITGPATVTITGNKFTLTPDGGGAPISGRVTAVTTRGYIGVTMMFGDTTPPPVTMSPPPLPAVSLRARLVGGHVTLVNVPGEKREFSFTSAVSMKIKTHRKVRTRRKSTAGAKVGDQNRSMDATIKPPTP